MLKKEMLNDIHVDDILEALGLERRGTKGLATLVPAISMFAVGAVIGAAVGMAFAPKPGSELRGDLGRRVSEIKNKISTNGKMAGAKTSTRAQARGTTGQVS